MNDFTLHDTLKALVEAQRLGGPIDQPEGTRYIQLSDTLVTKMIASITEAVLIYHPPK